MYLDPGFGGMLVQAIVAIAAVGGGLLFSFRKKIYRIFSKGEAKFQPGNIPMPNISDEAVDVLDNEVK
jgi:hypothetical protein